MKKTDEVKQLREALESANSICRIMAPLLERQGRGTTDWETLRYKLRESLALQHVALVRPAVRKMLDGRPNTPPRPPVKPVG